MMKIYRYFAISAALLLAMSHFAVAEDGVKKTMANVTLYGQEFTVTEQAVLKSALPSMFDGTGRDVKTVLETLGQSVDAQRTAYEDGLTQLATSLDEGGYLAAMFMRPNDDGYLSINLKDPVYSELLEGSEDNRVNYIKGEVEFWVAEGGWKDKVTAFNSLAAGHLPELDGTGIADLAGKHDSFKAVQRLDLAARQSDEVQAAGLSRYGIVEPNPVDVNVGGQEPSPPSWMGNANDGVNP